MFRLSKFSEVVSTRARLFFLPHSVPNVVSSFEYFESSRLTLRPLFSSFGSSVLIHRMICVEKRTQKKFSEFQMGIEPTTFQTSVEFFNH